MLEFLNLCLPLFSVDSRAVSTKLVYTKYLKANIRQVTENINHVSTIPFARNSHFSMFVRSVQ